MLTRCAGGASRWEDQMAEGAQVGSVVMFVHDLDRSVAFYADVLALEVADRSPTAALLSNAAGAGLILRAMGGAASHALGAIGVQYVVWAAADADDLARCERALAGRARPPRDAQQRRCDGGGGPRPRRHGGDGQPIPARARRRCAKLPARIYGW